MRRGVVSIIIPCFNGEEYVGRMLDSLLRQTYQKMQIIFVNDGSSDKTLEIAEEYQQRFYGINIEFKIVSQANKGLAGAINTGLLQVDGEYLMWIDADDFLEDNHVQKKVEFLETNPTIEVVRAKGNIYNENDLNTIIGILGDTPTVGTIFEDILFGYREPACGLHMVRTKALFEVLPSRQIYDSPVGQNMQILLPLVIRSNVGYIPDRLYNYIIRDNSHSHRFKNGVEWKTRFDVLEDMKRHVIESLDISRDHKKNLLKRLELHMLLMRIREIDSAIINADKTYVESIYKKIKCFSNIDDNLKNRKIFLWGACSISDCIIKVFEEFNDLRIEGYIDNDTKKVNREWNGRLVIGKDEISKKDMYIVCILNFHDDIVAFLKNKGFQHDKDYFYPEYVIRSAVKGESNDCI